MKLRLIALFLAVPLMGAGQTGYKYWSAADMKQYSKTLATKMGPNKSALDDRIIDYGDYFAAVVHREGDFSSEMHDHWADLYVITAGRATLIVGGTILGGKTTAPGEIRGLSINGGSRQNIAAGDIIHIPAKMPHQVLVKPGTQITYFIYKVKQ